MGKPEVLLESVCFCETFWIPMNHVEPAHPSPIFHGPSFRGSQKIKFVFSLPTKMNPGWCLRKQPKIMLGRCPSTWACFHLPSSWRFFPGVSLEVPWRDIRTSAQNPIVTLSGALLSIQDHGWCKGEGPELRIDLPGLGWWFLFGVRVTQSCFKKCLWYKSCTYYSVFFIFGALVVWNWQRPKKPIGASFF